MKKILVLLFMSLLLSYCFKEKSDVEKLQDNVLACDSKNFSKRDNFEFVGKVKIKNRFALVAFNKAKDSQTGSIIIFDMQGRMFGYYEGVYSPPLVIADHKLAMEGVFSFNFDDGIEIITYVLPMDFYIFRQSYCASLKNTKNLTHKVSTLKNDKEDIFFTLVEEVEPPLNFQENRLQENTSGIVLAKDNTEVENFWIVDEVNIKEKSDVEKLQDNVLACDSKNFSKRDNFEFVGKVKIKDRFALVAFNKAKDSQTGSIIIFDMQGRMFGYYEGVYNKPTVVKNGLVLKNETDIDMFYFADGIQTKVYLRGEIYRFRQNYCDSSLRIRNGRGVWITKTSTLYQNSEEIFFPIVKDVAPRLTSKEAMQKTYCFTETDKTVERHEDDTEKLWHHRLWIIGKVKVKGDYLTVVMEDIPLQGPRRVSNLFFHDSSGQMVGEYHLLHYIPTIEGSKLIFLKEIKEIANEYFDGKFRTTLDLSKGFPDVSLILGHHYDFKSCESYTGKNYLMDETEVEGKMSIPK